MFFVELFIECDNYFVRAFAPPIFVAERVRFIFQTNFGELGATTKTLCTIQDQSMESFSGSWALARYSDVVAELTTVYPWT
jgi:hypothetical protein